MQQVQVTYQPHHHILQQAQATGQQFQVTSQPHHLVLLQAHTTGQQDQDTVLMALLKDFSKFFFQFFLKEHSYFAPAPVVPQ